MKKKILLFIFMFCTIFIFQTKVHALESGKDLYKLMKSNAKTNNIDFNKRSGVSSGETNGIYITTNTENDVPVYYYRGTVNNNLIFNNMCWKIVRTTEKEGIKLIYNGLPNNGKCDNTGTSSQIGTSKFNTEKADNAYVGYMYGTVPSTTREEAHANTNNSTIKTYIENWYGTNFTTENVTSLIEDTVFYSDRSESTDPDLHSTAFNTNTASYGINRSSYASLDRSTYATNNLAPSLKYSVNNDKFTVYNKNGNGKLTYPVGLLTLDEAVLAGFNSQASSPSDYTDNNYLVTGEEYWTMSPVGYEGYVFENGSWVGAINNNHIDYFYVDIDKGVRPVIALSNEAVVKSTTDGTQNNPYFVALYTVKFDVNNIDNQYMFDNTSKAEKPANPTKDGYTFEGWYTDTGLTNKYDFNTIVSSNLTLYPKWNKLDINPQTGDSIFNNIVISVISLITLTACVLYINKKIRIN